MIKTDSLLNSLSKHAFKALHLKTVFHNVLPNATKKCMHGQTAKLYILESHGKNHFSPHRAYAYSLYISFLVIVKKLFKIAIYHF